MTLATASVSPGQSKVDAFFNSSGRTPFEFQRQTWNAYLRGESGLIQAPTGMGKTFAAAFGPIIENFPSAPARHPPPLLLLWITPLRALATDTQNSIRQALDDLKLNWTIELRTSDTSSSVRARQRKRLPTILVTTPESVSLLLSYEDSASLLGSVQCVVVDEWHELMSSKRGVQTELALARLRTISPSLRTWGISATMSNIEQAAATLLGPHSAPAAIIRAIDEKPIVLESILPAKIERFPWAGHLGLKLLQDVIAKLESPGSSMLFTNTRSQSELWFSALLNARPDWLGQIAIHHGSIDRTTRLKAEQLLREGKLRAVVCTSSLDLGVDFYPVDQVIQIGSPKSIARAIQRAGRSGHQPGAVSRIVCVPTQAFELIEFSAARHAIEHRALEPRIPLALSLDVLAQHVVTIAAGGGFFGESLFAEIRQTNSFSQITREQWQWVLDFAERGGSSLTAYPRFSRIRQDAPDHWVIASPQIARVHRMNIGTIAADGMMTVQFVGGKRLGAVEETFVTKLKPGDVFIFAGRILQFVRVFQMTALVRKATSRRGFVPRWRGGKLPMSSSLAAAVRMRIESAGNGHFPDPEMQAVQPILQLQQRWSALPQTQEMLIEQINTRDGRHAFLYPFQGRLVHEGLAALFVFRFGKLGIQPMTATFNDYGVELLTPEHFDLSEADWRALLSIDRLAEDLLACINSSELARRHFREIARIAGLLVPTRPGPSRSTRQLQASSELFFDVFMDFDPGNLLLEQARREVLERQLEFERMQTALRSIHEHRLLLTYPSRLTPLAFPLWAERIASQQLRMESSTDRIERIAAQLEKAANKEVGSTQ